MPMPARGRSEDGRGQFETLTKYSRGRAPALRMNIARAPQMTAGVLSTPARIDEAAISTGTRTRVTAKRPG